MASKQAQHMIDAQLGDLETRCRDLQTQMRVLKTQRNTYAAISQLPDEVLLEVFEIMRALDSEGDFKWYAPVTHVCRRWRCIAIESPTLWTNPPLRRHDFAMLMLDRSKSADLTIYMGFPIMNETIEGVLSCLSRVATLDITMDMYKLGDMYKFMASCGQQASRLTRFKFECIQEWRWDTRSMFALSAFSDLHLLRELDLTDVIFDWNILPLPNLEVLYLTGSIQTTGQKLLDSFRQMPHLQRLKIPVSRSLWPTYSTTETHPIMQVTLPHLSLLEIYDSTAGDAQRLLSNITLPRLRRMLIRPPGWDDFDLEERDPTQSARAIASAVVGGDFVTFDSLTFFRNSFRLNTFDQPQNEVVHVYFGMQNEDHNSDRLFNLISVDTLLQCRSQLVHLVEVEFDNYTMPVDSLLSLSTALSSVRKIEIHDSPSTALALIRVLSSLPSHYTPGSDDFIPFHRLVSITFFSVIFSNDTSMFDALYDCLMLRYEYNVPIHGLDIYYAMLSPSQLALLKGIVGEGNLFVRDYI